MSDTASAEGPSRLDLLKALGDNTRYAIYLELARSPVPLATSEISESLGLHVNTVRPHLERMREVGLLVVSADHRGSPGRPQHRYCLATDAPSLGLEAPAFPLLAEMLVRAAAAAGVAGDDAADAGRAPGAGMVGADDRRRPCVDALVAVLERLGFDPERVDEGDSSTVAFAHCPFRDLAEANPDLVCHLHRGLVEGFVAEWGDVAVTGFGTLVDRHPCRVEIERRVPVAADAG